MAKSDIHNMSSNLENLQPFDTKESFNLNNMFVNDGDLLIKSSGGSRVTGTATGPYEDTR